MKSTLSDNRQLFNIKALAAAGLKPEDIPEGEFGIVDTATELTVLPANYASLPDTFRFIQKINGKVIYSYDCINKEKIQSQIGKEYQAEDVNIWKTTIENCDCIDSVKLIININDDSLLRRDGLTWTHNDFIVELSPQELKCLCDCSGKTTYENHLMTKLFFDKIKSMNSAFYDVEVQDESGTVYADSAAIQAFIDANKVVNTDDDDLNDSEKLVLFIKGKVQPAGTYNTLETNYTYPRGVRLNPAITVNGNITNVFEEVQNLVYEIGAGYDLRDEEWNYMNLYTNLNFYPQLSDGIANPNINFQFENSTNYDTFTFEFGSKKSGLEDVYEGRYKIFSVLLGTETGSGIFAQLQSIFTP